jgi:hypothetical protein
MNSEIKRKVRRRGTRRPTRATRTLPNPKCGELGGYIGLVRYLVKARVKPGKEPALNRAIDHGTLGKGSIAGDEYVYDMKQARVNEKGVATWVETCFCHPPLAEERPYWEEYFDLLKVKDAHSRRNCRHEKGTELWACCDCDCTRRLEKKIANQGESYE